MISNKAAKKIKEGIGPRVRKPGEDYGFTEGHRVPPPRKKPKASLPQMQYDRKTKKIKYK